MPYKEKNHFEDSQIRAIYAKIASKRKRSTEQPMFCQDIYYPKDQHLITKIFAFADVILFRQ